MKLENLKPGMVVYDVHSYRMGNTTIRSVGVWPVKIVSVDTLCQSVMARWNCNEARKYWHSSWSKWREKEPMLIQEGFGRNRLATREEIKAARGLRQ